MSDRSVVIVDGYSTGRYLPAEFGRYGVTCIHVMSAPTPPPAWVASYIPANFKRNVPFEADLDTLCRRIGAEPVLAVIAGAESGTELADRLAEKLGLRGNDPSTSSLRRNKYAMVERIRAVGLHAARQVVTTSAAAADIWARQNNSWPIVVKPVKSAASDGVTYCDDPSAVRSAFHRILHQTNFVGLQNDEVLLQSYLDGQQYIVNAVSQGGVHLFSDVWRVTLKPVPGASNIVDHKISVTADDPVLAPLLDYTCKALDALGIEEGASHSELRDTPSGIALIETAARMMGNSMERDAFVSAFGHSQASLVAMRFSAPEQFREYRNIQPYGPKKHIAIIHLNFDKPGVLRSAPGLERARDLASFHGVFNPPKIGETVGATMDNRGHGHVYLLHEDRKTLERDLAEFVSWRDAGRVFDLDAFNGA